MYTCLGITQRLLATLLKTSLVFLCFPDFAWIIQNTKTLEVKEITTNNNVYIKQTLVQYV